MTLDPVELGLPVGCKMEPIEGVKGDLMAITIEPLEYVTIDFDRRHFWLGFGRSSPNLENSPAAYVGKGWKKRIAMDAYLVLKEASR